MPRLSPAEKALRAEWEAILAAKGRPSRPPRTAPVNSQPDLFGAVPRRQPVVRSSSEHRGIGYYMGKNVTIADGFFADATRRLREAGTTPAQTALAVQTLGLIVGSLAFESFRATATTNSLSQELGLNSGRVATTLALLEKVGLIVRLSEGRRKSIILNPRLVYRGSDKAIGELVRNYDAMVKTETPVE